MDTFPSGINNAGQITGFYYTDDPVVFASGFVKTGDVYSVFDVPGARATMPTGINDAGLIVGNWSDDAGAHGFLKDGGTYSEIAFPGAIHTAPLGINAAGDIVGTYVDVGGVSYGFIKRGDDYLPLHLLSEASGINDAGLIAGVRGSGALGLVTDGVHVAYVNILLPFGGDAPADIDNIGRVLGSTRDGDSRAHGFLATPTADWTFEPDLPPPSTVPEPVSAWLCGLGLAAAVVRRHTATKR